MTKAKPNADRWLLPDGVEEILPGDAAAIESLRRRLIDIYKSWGYDQVIPPLIEYTDSLLIGMGEDIDLLTFKMTDQLSGRTLGIRADITPQVARMDAHSCRREGPHRLCYAGHVLHTRPKGPLATRSPIQAGVELFGEAGLEADIEVISLMLECLGQVGLKRANIDLGHVGIYRAVVESAQLNEGQQRQYFDLLQHKAISEIEAWVAEHIEDETVANLLNQLPRLAGDRSVLDKARAMFESVSEEALAALDELESVADVICLRYPNTHLYFDLGELRGYHYHTGIVFAAFAQGQGEAIANGGRYDHIGEVFGRSRAATGFALDVTKVVTLLESQPQTRLGIYAPASKDPQQWLEVQRLRAAGERVVCGLARQPAIQTELHCDRTLVLGDQGYQVQAW
jgi:ATP phosphoribosyltransferase regulatory subunit